MIGFVLTKLPTDLLSFVELSYKQDIYHALPLFLYIAGTILYFSDSTVGNLTTFSSFTCHYSFINLLSERYDEVDKCSYLEDILKRARGPAHKNFLNLFQVGK